MRTQTILACTLLIFNTTNAIAFDVPKACEERMRHYLNHYEDFYHADEDSVENVSLCIPFMLAGIEFRDLLELEKDSDLMDIPKCWTYNWTLIADSALYKVIYVQDDGERYGITPTPIPQSKIVKELRDNHPEYELNDIYLLGTHGPKHNIIIIDIDEKLIVTSPDEVTRKMLGIVEDGQNEYSFGEYEAVLLNLLQAAKEDYEREMKMRKETGRMNDVLAK